VIDELSAIMFPPATSMIDPNRLYFTAGLDEEKDGIFEYLIKQQVKIRMMRRIKQGV